MSIPFVTPVHRIMPLVDQVYQRLQMPERGRLGCLHSGAADPRNNNGPDRANDRHV